MNDVPGGAVSEAAPAVSPKVARSPLLNQLRQNPFRVLRLPVDAGVDEAIWRSEEALTLLRGGLPLNEPDPFPWLPAPDEDEIRQSVQCMEEPLRRALEQLLWFDFKSDPDGELLQRAMAGLDAGALSRYLAAPPAAGALAAVINRANLHLLLAALALTDALPKPWPGLSSEGNSTTAPSPLKWRASSHLRVAEGPHELVVAHGRRTVEVTANLWQQALARWTAVLEVPQFLDHLKAGLTRLGDESVGEEDAETLVNSLQTRLTDLLVGEVKVQFLEGRLDRVRALLGVAAQSSIEPRRWVLALRPLRPLFKTEVDDLDVLLGDTSALRLENLELYISRLKGLVARWGDLDPGGLLGLGEMTDEAAFKVGNLLAGQQEYATAERVKKLIEAVAGAATAASVRQRVLALQSRFSGAERWLCHYCGQREMDVNCSAMLNGKKETSRTRYGNTVTIHYRIKRDIVQRCPRCTNLHEFIRWVGYWTWLGLLPLYILFGLFNQEAIVATLPLIWLAVMGVTYWVSGYVARAIAGLVVTPHGERRCWDVSTSRQYKALGAEGYSITLNYSKGAFAAAVAASKK
jgi:hypothetical protein